MTEGPCKNYLESIKRLPQCGKQIYPMTPGLLEQVMGGDFKTEWEAAQVRFKVDVQLSLIDSEFHYFSI